MTLQQHSSLEVEQDYRSICGLASQCCKVLSISIHAGVNGHPKIMKQEKYFQAKKSFIQLFLFAEAKNHRVQKQ